MGVNNGLFELLAQAGSQDRGALADAKEAAAAFTGLMGGYRHQQEYNRDQQVKNLLDQQVPKRTLKRIFGTTALPMSLAGLKELSSAGVSNLLKDPSADFFTAALLASGGDPTKASNLMKIFGTNTGDDEEPTLNPATVSLFKIMKPKEIAASTAPELRAVAANISAELKTDIPEDRRKLLSENLELINQRLAKSGGVTLKTAPTVPVKPKAQAGAGVSADEAAAIKALADAVNK